MAKSARHLLILGLITSLMLGVSGAALASTARLKALAGLNWVIADDLDCFLNPAVTALRGEGYLALGGGLESRELELDYDHKREEAHGVTYLVLSPRKLFGAKHSFGGWVQYQLEQRQDRRAVTWGDAYTLDRRIYGFNLMDAFRVDDQLSLAGSFTCLPEPKSRTFEYDDGYTSEHRDDGREMHFEGAAVYQLSPELTLEADAIGTVGDSSVDHYSDGVYDGHYDFTRRGRELSGKLTYAPFDWARLVLLGQNSSYEDRSNSPSLDDDRSSSRLLAGLTMEPFDFLLLAGSIERVYGDSEYTALRAAGELEVGRLLQLRAGLVRRAYPGGTATCDVTAGGGLTLGRGQLDLFLHPIPSNPESVDSFYGGAELSYTVRF